MEPSGKLQSADKRQIVLKHATLCVRLQLKVVTQQLAADSTNVPLRITSAEVVGAFGSANHNAAAAVFEYQGKFLSQDPCYGQRAFVIHHQVEFLVLDPGNKEAQDHSL